MCQLQTMREKAEFYTSLIILAKGVLGKGRSRYVSYKRGLLKILRFSLGLFYRWQAWEKENIDFQVTIAGRDYTRTYDLEFPRCRSAL